MKFLINYKVIEEYEYTIEAEDENAAEKAGPFILSNDEYPIDSYIYEKTI